MASDPLGRLDPQPGGVATAPALPTRPDTVTGEYRESPDDAHRAFRTLLLNRTEWLPEPPMMLRPVGRADDVARAVPDIRAALRATGLVRVIFDRALSTGELLRLGEGLGGAIAQPGTDSLPDYVENELVFNLRQDAGATDPEDPMTMVGTNPLNLHSEISMRPLTLQPRFVVLHCVEPPERDRGGQTVLVPMAGVLADMSERRRGILRDVVLRAFPDAPPVLRDDGGFPVLCFRDWEMETLAWAYQGTDGDVTEDEVDDALAAILLGMHDPANTWGIDWTAGSVLIWDNWRFFHGRTRTHGTRTRRRHLQRLYLRSTALEDRSLDGKEDGAGR